MPFSLPLAAADEVSNLVTDLLGVPLKGMLVEKPATILYGWRVPRPYAVLEESSNGLGLFLLKSRAS